MRLRVVAGCARTAQETNGNKDENGKVRVQQSLEGKNVNGMQLPRDFSAWRLGNRPFYCLAFRRRCRVQVVDAASSHWLDYLGYH